MAVNLTTTTDPRTKERAPWAAIKRGLKSTCPACGIGALYRKYLKVHDHCPTCNEALHHHRADDAPAYFTIVIVGHIVIAGLLLLEQTYAPSTFVHLAIWIPLLLALSLLLLPIVKGALISLQWAFRMHGFGEDDPISGEGIQTPETY